MKKLTTLLFAALACALGSSQAWAMPTQTLMTNQSLMNQFDSGHTQDGKLYNTNSVTGQMNLGNVRFTNPSGVTVVSTDDGGQVTFSVLTGTVTYTPKGGQPTTLTQGNTGKVNSDGLTTVMSTADAIKSGTLSGVTNQGLLYAVSALATIANNNPGNAVLSAALGNVVTAVTKAAALSGNTALVQNVVAVAVANSSKDQQQAIVTAALKGFSSTDTTLTAAVTAGSNAGAQSRANINTVGVNDSYSPLTIKTSVDPSQVALVSSSR
jgi:hypothetical protein